MKSVSFSSYQIKWVIYLCLAAVGCKKPARESEVNTLDKLVGAVEQRACAPEPGVTWRVEDWNIQVVGYDAQAANLKQIAAQTLAAAPLGLQRVFQGLGGEIIVVADPMSYCPSEIATKDSVDAVACWDFLPAAQSSSVGLGGRAAAEALKPRARIAASGAGEGRIIKQSLLRGLGFLYASKFVEIGKLNDNAFQSDLASLASAVIEDVNKGGMATSGSMFERILSPEFIAKAQNQRQQEFLNTQSDPKLSYAKFVLFAETFDSYYCDAKVTRVVLEKGQKFERAGVAFEKFRQRLVDMTAALAAPGRGFALADNTMMLGMFAVLAVMLVRGMSQKFNAYPPGSNYGYGGMGYNSNPNNYNNGYATNTSYNTYTNSNYNTYTNTNTFSGNNGYNGNGLQPIQPNYSGGGSNTAQVIQLTNQFRAQQGKSPFTEDSALTSSCKEHATWMATNRNMIHYSERPDYPGPRNIGENVAAGQRSPFEVVNAWIKSPGHRANLLRDYRTIGAADTNNYWCQQFR